MANFTLLLLLGLIVVGVAFPGQSPCRFLPLEQRLLNDLQSLPEHSVRHSGIFHFNPQCQQRGRLKSTSFIPPEKAKEHLVPAKKIHLDAG